MFAKIDFQESPMVAPLLPVTVDTAAIAAIASLAPIFIALNAEPERSNAISISVPLIRAV